MEFISWVVDDNKSYFWWFIDIINGLRGLWLLIFCVFLADRVRSKLHRKIFKHSGPERGPTFSRNNTFKTSAYTSNKDTNSMPIERVGAEEINMKEM